MDNRKKEVANQMGSEARKQKGIMLEVTSNCTCIEEVAECERFWICREKLSEGELSDTNEDRTVMMQISQRKHSGRTTLKEFAGIFYNIERAKEKKWETDPDLECDNFLGHRRKCLLHFMSYMMRRQALITLFLISF